QVGDAVEGIVGLPLVGGAVAAGLQQAMEHGQEDGAFDGEGEAAVGEQVVQDGVATGLVPEALEDEHRAEALATQGGDVAGRAGGEQQRLLREASAGSEQGFQAAVLLEAVEAAQSGDHTLAGAAVVPVVLDDLQVAAWAGWFDAEEHAWGLRNETPCILRR